MTLSKRIRSEDQLHMVRRQRQLRRVVGTALMEVIKGANCRVRKVELMRQRDLTLQEPADDVDETAGVA